MLSLEFEQFLCYSTAQLPKARRLELQAKQLAAAYEQLAADSEKHITALQRNLAVAVDERKQAMRQLDHVQVQLATVQKEKASLESENVHLKIKVQQLEEDVKALREQTRLLQVDLREIVVDRDLLRQSKEGTDRELEWLRSKHNTVLQHQKVSLEGMKSHHAVTLEETADAANFAKSRLEDDFGKLTAELARVQETVASWSESTSDEHLEVLLRTGFRLVVEFLYPFVCS